MSQGNVEHHLGYLCTEPPYENAPGGSRLHVYVRNKPTGRHFDPMKLRVTIKDDVGKGVTSFVVEYPWPGAERHQACASRLTLTDHVGKEVDLFTFGGTLDVRPEGEEIHCTLTSPVPILDWQDETALPAKLASEAEILLSERQAFYAASNEELFAHKLAMAEPRTLYAAILQALLQKLGKIHETVLQALELHDLHLFLQEEIARLHRLSLWPARVPPLDDLL